ncbi:uncharacterized protein N7525_005028, partial [Penicillium rubens]|uniref:uncharacterized protein n=1 Tax=Penicillium rubens TaxID=1108849 RepID=UPI002A5A705F
VVRVSDTCSWRYVIGCSTNTLNAPLFDGKSRDHRQYNTVYLQQGTRNFPSEIETRSLSFLDLVSLALAYLHYFSHSSPLLRLTSS